MTTRAQIVAAARSYINTPYLHLGRVPGVGLDCAGVVVCAGRDTGCWSKSYDFEHYAKGAAEGHMIVERLSKHMGSPVQRGSMQPGDVIVLWADVRAQHMGIVGDYRHGGLSIIHAMTKQGVDRTVETRLMPSVKFAAAFSYPGVV